MTKKYFIENKTNHECKRKELSSLLKEKFHYMTIFENIFIKSSFLEFNSVFEMYSKLTHLKPNIFNKYPSFHPAIFLFDLNPSLQVASYFFLSVPILLSFNPSI